MAGGGACGGGAGEAAGAETPRPARQLDAAARNCRRAQPGRALRAAPAPGPQREHDATRRCCSACGDRLEPAAARDRESKTQWDRVNTRWRAV
eukprot:2763880-Rhodomonas_salina.2